LINEIVRLVCETGLGHAWKKVLSHSNEELKINEEFTHKGFEALLEKLERLIASAHGAEEFKY
jgi:hypothetical protein